MASTPQGTFIINFVNIKQLTLGLLVTLVVCSAAGLWQCSNFLDVWVPQPPILAQVVRELLLSMNQKPRLDTVVILIFLNLWCTSTLSTTVTVNLWRTVRTVLHVTANLWRTVRTILHVTVNLWRTVRTVLHVTVNLWRTVRTVLHKQPHMFLQTCQTPVTSSEGCLYLTLSSVALVDSTVLCCGHARSCSSFTSSRFDSRIHHAFEATLYESLPHWKHQQ